MIRVLRKLSRIRSPANCNLVRYASCNNRPAIHYQVRLAFQDDYPRVMRFMADTYFRSEPSILHMGTSLSDKPNKTLVYLMDKSIHEGMTIIIEDLYNENCIVGAAVNIDAHDEDAENAAKLAERCGECREARDLIEFYSFCSKQADLWNIFGVRNIFECAHVAVHSEHMGRGLARKLVEESWLLARDMAYRLFRIDCSSSYTAKIAQKYHWTCVYSIPYGRYFKDNRFIFNCVKEPHTVYQIYVDRLDYYDKYLPSTKPRKRR